MLHKYTRLGNKVFVIIARDGKDGTRITKISAGDSLGTLRKMESACSCKTLGAEPPIFSGIERLDIQRLEQAGTLKNISDSWTL